MNGNQSAVFFCFISQDMAPIRAQDFTHRFNLSTKRVLENSAAQGLCLISCCKHIPVSGALKLLYICFSPSPEHVEQQMTYISYIRASIAHKQVLLCRFSRFCFFVFFLNEILFRKIKE